MENIEKVIEATIRQAPKSILERHLSNKFRLLGLKVPPSQVENVADLILGGKEGQIKIDGINDDSVLEFTEEDQQSVLNDLEIFQNKLPEILRSAAANCAADLIKETKAQWRHEGPAQRADTEAFKARLEHRWGKGLDLMRMMLSIVREWLANRHKKRSRRKKQSHLDAVQMRLLARACQVVNEIIILLENGFADGAIARWRTLHEITIVAALLSKFGEDIAERYVLYQVVESYQAMNAFERNHSALGYKPLSQAEKRRIHKAYRALLERFGEAFGGEYGWAAHHLGMKGKSRVHFARLESEVENAHMRSPYKMASYNVHASPKGIYFRIGNLAEAPTMLAGASNAGLTDPAQHTAISFAQLAITVIGGSASFMDLLTAEALLCLRTMIPTEFWKADKKLRRDDRQHRRSQKGK